MSESLETIQREFDESQGRSLARREDATDRRQFWTVFWVVFVLGCWIVVGLWALGIVKY